MNWAKRLLTAGDCSRCGGRLEDLGDGQVSCDTCTYPEPEEDERIVCDQCGAVIPGGVIWCLDVGDGTEHFCSADCRNKRAAEIESAPRCAWCLEKCDQGVVRIPGNPAPFCSTYCAEQWSLGRKP